MKVFDAKYLDDLTMKAKTNPRSRQHQNIHLSYQDACQRLFNAIEPSAYIHPHRHTTEMREELLIAIRGMMALITFDDQGCVTNIMRFASQHNESDLPVGAEVTPTTWHTVIALVPGSVLLEVKAGPFDPKQPKDLAPWAPEEGSAIAQSYSVALKELAGKFSGP